MNQLNNTKLLSSFLLASYAFGFIIWNFFLGIYGFFEYNLLQTRFLSAGILFLLIPSLLYACINNGKPSTKKNILVAIVILFIWLPFYTKFIFPKIPQYLGGGMPFVTTVLVNREQESLLSAVELTLLPDSKVQTLPVCQLYSNSDFFIFGISSFNTEYKDGKTFFSATTSPGRRVIILRQNEIKGLQSVVPLKPAYKQFCEGFK